MSGEQMILIKVVNAVNMVNDVLGGELSRLNAVLTAYKRAEWEVKRDIRISCIKAGMLDTSDSMGILSIFIRAVMGDDDGKLKVDDLS